MASQSHFEASLTLPETQLREVKAQRKRVSVYICVLVGFRLSLACKVNKKRSWVGVASRNGGLEERLDSFFGRNYCCGCLKQFFLSKKRVSNEASVRVSGLS